MGLIKAATSAIGSTFGDQFLDGIRCEDMGNDILMKKISPKNGTIAHGSKFIVSPGQVAVIFDNGNILDATAEPGIYTFDSKSTPSFFGGDFGDVFKEMWTRFKFGGAIAKEQAIFYFNIKEIIGNKFGTPNPVPYKDWGHPLLNARTGGYSAMRLEIKCFGTYTFKITNPALFMEKITGVADIYTKEDLVEQMRSEVVGAFSNILNSLSEEEHKVEALSLPNKTDEIREIMNESIFDQSIRDRGISLVVFNVESVSLTEDSKKKIDEYELAGDQYSQQGVLTSAYANAVQDAAKNSGGAINGFMGLGVMNMNSGNVFGGVTSNIANSVDYKNPAQMQNNKQDLAVSQTENTTVEPENVDSNLSEPKTEENNNMEKVAWKCACGAENYGKFCSECGNKREEENVCPKCKAKVGSDDKFCEECGQKLK